MLDIIATAVLVVWALQGLHLTKMTLGGGYHPFWAGLLAVATLALILPTLAIWL